MQLGFQFIFVITHYCPGAQKYFRMKLLVVILFCCSIFNAANAQLRLPALIRDSMILQRDVDINIWGWLDAGKNVKIIFNKKHFTAKAGNDGKWKIILPAMPAGGPYTMNIVADTTIVLKEILIGDVWLCSGQSNMVLPMERVKEKYPEEIATAYYPTIRQFFIPATTDLQQTKDDLPKSYWKPADKSNILQFSATAYFFAKMIYAKYHVPIGLINASVGGTPIEAWMSEGGLKNFADITAVIQKNKDTAYVNDANRKAFEYNQKLNAQRNNDKGLKEITSWFDTTYIPKGWSSINIPGYWEDQGIKDLNGVVWYRKEINISASMASTPAKIFMGRIVDADYLYINGKLVGNTTYQYPPRRYNIPPGILKPGKNIIVIRVINTAGKGGFVPDKPYYLVAANDTIDLKGTWSYKVGEVYTPSSEAPAGIAFQNQPTALFNAMIAPLVHFSIKGFLWYQGETNANNPHIYAKLLPALIADWRSQWKQNTLPFLYVQLPNFMDVDYLPSESNWAVLREAQLQALNVSNTGMAITIDLGEWNDIHPLNKKDVGYRLALAAQKVAYHETSLVSSGPIFQSVTTDDNKIIINFTNTGSGLVTNDNEEPRWFSIAGADKKFVWANAKIKGNTIVVWNDSIAQPLYVRYAWADNPANVNVYNKEGLPASPFRTDKE